MRSSSVELLFSSRKNIISTSLHSLFDFKFIVSAFMCFCLCDFDNGPITDLHAASVADVIVSDNTDS